MNEKLRAMEPDRPRPLRVSSLEPPDDSLTE
jgi:hypothetical protein